MRILGIDPGLHRTGYGLIDAGTDKIKLLEAGTIEPKQKDSLEHRVYKIYGNLEALIKEYQPDVIVLEKLYTHYQYPTIACLLGHVRGVICLLSVKCKVKLAEHSVKRIRKALVGAGQASKLQTQGMVAHMLKIDRDQLTADASDALALALGYAQMISNKL